jgi:hypothetical protein
MLDQQQKKSDYSRKTYLVRCKGFMKAMQDTDRTGGGFLEHRQAFGKNHGYTWIVKRRTVTDMKAGSDHGEEDMTEGVSVLGRAPRKVLWLSRLICYARGSIEI